jgi:transposase InsO family protein
VKKLNQKKIRWKVREMNKEDKSVYRMANIMNVSSRWIKEVYRVHQETGQYLFPRKPGKRPHLVSNEERNLIIKTRKEHPISGVLALVRILDSHGVYIPHNRIHRILKEEVLAIDEPSKQRHRKRIRNELRFSNTLWHADLFEKRQDHVILSEDNVSRFITGYWVFRNATAKNSMLVLEKAVQQYGIPRPLMTAHGKQFTSLPRDICSDPRPSEFQQILQNYGIRHIKARVKHPQSNEKVERVGQTLQRL